MAMYVLHVVRLARNEISWKTMLIGIFHSLMLLIQLNHSRYVHIILTTCFPANPKDLWKKYKDYMSEDILHRMRRLNANPNIQCTSNIYNESLTELGMITLNRSGNDIFDQQRTAYDTIINAIYNKSCGLYFLDAPDGTGKTFLILIILARITTLLDGDRTAHSALKMPLNMQVTETPTCNISKYSGMGKVLRSRQLNNMG
ncbi:uncharacterized protein LOC143432478 [Xylocopa sonorina]|uniref:uncharacterized protein LOC143432237 n=1 Tax=Xylocopa sonorina TaxID=1818115 RepID=UPI00403B0D3A